MSNVNQLAARVPCAAGSNNVGPVSILPTGTPYPGLASDWHLGGVSNGMPFVTLWLCTEYYLYWVAMGLANTQAEWDNAQAGMDSITPAMHAALSSAELEDFLTICED